jgi:hypothetical protein
VFPPWLLTFAIITLTGQAHRVAADQPDGDLPQRLDRQLEEALTGRPVPKREGAPVEDILQAVPADMRAAGTMLGTKQLEAAAERQRDVLARLDQLLGQMSSMPLSPSAGSSQGELAGSRQGGEDEQGRQTGAPGDGAAGEATSGSRPGEAGAVRLQRRRDQATAVWGHLPDRVREQMQQSYRERYLPEYEDLVERYYEALADDRLDRADDVP